MNTIYKMLIVIFVCLHAVGLNAQNLLYYNNFTVAQAGWRDFEDDLSKSRISGSQYILTHKQHSSSVMSSIIPVDYSRNFAIETTVTHLDGDNFPIGITFQGQDSFNLNYFAISHTGQFIVAAFEQGTSKIIVNYTVSSAIHPGSEANKLRVEKSDNQFKYFINNTEVAHTAVLQRYGDAIGVLVGGQQTAAFDYLKVAYTNPVVNHIEKAVKVVNTDITEMAYHTDFEHDDENEWVLPPTDSVKTALANGRFTISRSAKGGFTASVTGLNTKIDFHRDYLIETSAIHYSGTLNYGYGLDFDTDSIRQYHFWLASGYYSIGYTHNGVYNSMIPWTESDAINKTALSANKLSIMHKGGQLSFYINDQLATTYPETKPTGHRFGLSVSANQKVSFKYLTYGYLDKASHIEVPGQADVTPPEITVISPQVTRGLKVVQSSDVLHVAGIAKDASGIFSVVVNGIQATVDKSGNFIVDVPMALGDNPLMIVATDMNMNKGTYKFNIVRNNVPVSAQATITQAASHGKFYALLIGVQDYKDQTIQSLEGPIGDATTLLQALASHYTFQSEDITLLKNPTRADFFHALDEVSGKIKSEDNLVIFYAGHGFYDEGRHQGYWFPADADRQHRDTWISNADLIDYITAIKSKHTLLISDACFSGSIFKTRSIEMAPKDIQELYKLPSRKAMTSGNMKEVPDKSVFMHYLVERLNQNTDKFLPAEQLFSSFRAAVINNSPNQQIPQFGEIRESGDEGGDFIFIKKE